MEIAKNKRKSIQEAEKEDGEIKKVTNELKSIRPNSKNEKKKN